MRAVLFARGNAAEIVAARLSRISNVHLSIHSAPEDVASALPDADILILQQSTYSGIVEEAACASERLRWIQLLSAGYDNLHDRRISPGVTVTSAGPSFANSVADHALALLLSLTRRIPKAVTAQSQGLWQAAPLKESLSLDGRVALVLGFGSIGKAIATRLRGFGMLVRGVSRTGAPQAAAERMYAFDRLDEALSDADVIMVALPQSPLTQGLFDKDRLERCKRGAYLVNIARGALVDLAALTDALASGHIAGAGLDVTNPEPLPEVHPAWSAPNLLITPHTGGLGAQDALADFIARNAESFIAGRPLEARIDLSRR